jgi:hypothetical protein
MKVPTTKRAGSSLSRQRGVTLIIALIMLMVLGLLAVYAVRAGMANLLIVNNTQLRHEAFATAQAAIESTLSSTAFMTHPANVSAAPVAFDLDGDGRPDMSAALTPAPACYRARVVKSTELDPSNAADLACMVSNQSGGSGIDSASSATAGNSLCADNE